MKKQDVKKVLAELGAVPDNQGRYKKSDLEKILAADELAPFQHGDKIKAKQQVLMLKSKKDSSPDKFYVNKGFDAKVDLEDKDGPCVRGSRREYRYYDTLDEMQKDWELVKKAKGMAAGSKAIKVKKDMTGEAPYEEGTHEWQCYVDIEQVAPGSFAKKGDIIEIKDLVEYNGNDPDIGQDYYEKHLPALIRDGWVEWADKGD